MSAVPARGRRQWPGRSAPFALPDPTFASRIGWMEEVRTWDDVRRAAMTDALCPVLATADFVPNAYDRRCHVPALDGSLLAPQQALQAFVPNPA